jgi:hypothetical protein
MRGRTSQKICSTFFVSGFDHENQWDGSPVEPFLRDFAQAKLSSEMISFSR